MGAHSAAPREQYVDIEVIQRLLKGTDFIVLTIGAMLISVVSARSLEGPDAAAVVGFLAIELAFVSLFAMRSLGLYDSRALVNGVRGAAMSVATSYVVGGVMFAATNWFLFPMRWQWLVSWLVLLVLHFALTRGAVALWARPRAAQGRFRKRIAIVGGGKAAEDAIHVLENSRDIDIDIAGIFDDRFDERRPQAIRLHRKIGKIDELAEFARSERVDLIVVAIPMSAEARLLHILKRLWELPVDIRISGQASSLKLSPRAYTYLGDLPLLSVFDRPLSAWGWFLKSFMDRVLAAAAIVVLSPLMLVVAAAVRLESGGPVIFKQRRYGFNNDLIQIYKFRSLRADMCDAAAERLVTRGDPRVTRVGRIIRRTSIDELPQLFNVLSGQLSLVGPRPHVLHAKAANALYEQVVDGYFARHKVKPGMTGWAQINGWRGETDTKEKIEQRVKHDLEYIDRWSLLFDLYVIAKTPFALLKAQNAY